MTISQGAAVEYIEKLYGGRYEENDVIVSVGTAATRIVGNSPDRLTLTIINYGANTVYLQPINAPAVKQGIIIDAQGGSVSMNVRDDLTLPSLEWWGIADTAASDIFVLEVTRYRLPAATKGA